MTLLPTSSRSKTLVCVVVTHWLALGGIGTAWALPADLDSPPVYTVWKTVGVQDGLPHDSIRAIRVWGDEVWVATDGGLARLDATGWKAWTPADGLPPYPISAIDIDPDTRDLWLGTWGGGLARFSAGRCDLFNQFNSGLAGDLVFAVILTEGRVWVATNGGLSVFDPSADSWELYYPRRADPSGAAVTDLLRVDGSLSTVLRHVRIGQFELEPMRLPGATATVWRRIERATHADAPDRASSVRLPSPLGSTRAHIQCLAPAPGGQVWVGTNKGLQVLAPLPSQECVTYQADDNGHGSVITLSHGDAQLAELREVPVIPDNNIRCIVFDRKGVWVGTAHGLVHGSRPVSWVQAVAAAASGQKANADGEATALAHASSSPLPAQPPTVTPSAIAVYGPRNRTISLPGEPTQESENNYGPDLFTIEMIVERASRSTNAKAVPPIELQYIKPGYSRYGWGLPEDDMIVFSRNPHILGIIGAIGRDELITNAAAARTEVPWIHVARNGEGHDERDGVGGASNPWVFQCWGGLPRQHRILLEYVFGKLGCSRPAVLRTPESGLHLDWWADYAGQRGHPLVADVQWESDATDQETSWEVLRRGNADVVLTWCDKRTTAKILRSMRRAGMRQWLVGGPAIVAEDFATAVGTDPGPIMALVPQDAIGDTSSEEWFRREYTAQSSLRGSDALPNARALRSWAATDHLMEAIRRSPPDRPSVRQTLEDLSRSAWGEAHYERMHPRGSATIARLQDGHWVIQTVFGAAGD